MSFSEAAKAELDNLMDKVITIVKMAYDCMKDPDSIPLSEIEEREQEIDDLVDEYKNAHISRMEKKQCSADIGMIYVEMLTDLERIGDHAMNIAEAGIKA